MNTLNNARTDNIAKGILFIVLSGLSFSAMNVAIRLAGDIPSMQKCVFRNSIALIIAIGYMYKNRVPVKSDKGNTWLLIGRGLCGTIGVLGNYYAVDHMNIGDASLMNKISPFIALCGAAIFLKERFTWVHLLTVIGAFIGCIFVIQPSGDFAQMHPAVIALCGGIGAGFALTFLRALGRRDENSTRVIFYFSAISTIVTVPTLFFNAVPMTGRQWIIMIIVGLLAALGQLFITKAYYYAPPRSISVFDFSQVLFSALFGFLFFQQIPGPMSLVGYVLIISMGVLLFFYNKRPHSGRL